MTSVTSKPTSTPAAPIALRAALWVGQVLLMAMFLMAGSMKLFTPGEFPYPHAFTYFVGISEILGAFGVVLPALTRIRPGLTPLAAIGLASIMVLATGYHVMRSEPFLMTAALAGIAVFVAWGRGKKAPIPAR